MSQYRSPNVQWGFSAGAGSENSASASKVETKTENTTPLKTWKNKRKESSGFYKKNKVELDKAKKAEEVLRPSLGFNQAKQMEKEAKELYNDMHKAGSDSEDNFSYRTGSNVTRAKARSPSALSKLGRRLSARFSKKKEEEPIKSDNFKSSTNTNANMRLSMRFSKKKDEEKRFKSDQYKSSSHTTVTSPSTGTSKKGGIRRLSLRLSASMSNLLKKSSSEKPAEDTPVEELSNLIVINPSEGLATEEAFSEKAPARKPSKRMSLKGLSGLFKGKSKEDSSVKTSRSSTRRLSMKNLPSLFKKASKTEQDEKSSLPGTPRRRKPSRMSLKNVNLFRKASKKGNVELRASFEESSASMDEISIENPKFKGKSPSKKRFSAKFKELGTSIAHVLAPTSKQEKKSDKTRTESNATLNRLERSVDEGSSREPRGRRNLKNLPSILQSMTEEEKKEMERKRQSIEEFLSSGRLKEEDVRQPIPAVAVPSVGILSSSKKKRRAKKPMSAEMAANVDKVLGPDAASPTTLNMFSYSSSSEKQQPKKKNEVKERAIKNSGKFGKTSDTPLDQVRRNQKRTEKGKKIRKLAGLEKDEESVDENGKKMNTLQRIFEKRRRAEEALMPTPSAKSKKKSIKDLDY